MGLGTRKDLGLGTRKYPLYVVIALRFGGPGFARELMLFFVVVVS